MRPEIRLCLLTLALGGLALPATAMADQMRVGIAATVVEDVRASLGNQAPQPVVVGEDVFFDERVITTTDARAVVQFRDRSTLDIGPDATVVIDRSVFNPVESDSEKVITVVKGAFRFVSGVSTKTSDTEVRTPAGTLGIRGSVIVGLVDTGGAFLVVPEGHSTWTGPSGISNVPEGGALITTFGGGPPIILQQPTDPMLGLINSLIAKLGATPPPPKSLVDPGNAKDHLKSGSEQSALQPVNLNGPTGGQGGAGGPSEIGNVFLSLQTGGPGGTDPTINKFMTDNAGSHDTNEVVGVRDVILELAPVMTQEELDKLALELASFSQDPNLVLAEIFQAANPPPPPTNNTFGTFGSSAGTGAGSSVSNGGSGGAGGGSGGGSGGAGGTNP
jgi:FecR protein